MSSPLPHEARAIDAAFRAILAQDWPQLASLQHAYPHLMLDPGAMLTYGYPASYAGMRGWATWNWEENAYVVEAQHDSAARWVGYRIAEESGIEVIWWGTEKTRAGTWVAQFTVSEEEA